MPKRFRHEDFPPCRAAVRPGRKRPYFSIGGLKSPHKKFMLRHNKGLLKKKVNALIRHAFVVPPSPEIGGRLSFGFTRNHLSSPSDAIIW